MFCTKVRGCWLLRVAPLSLRQKGITYCLYCDGSRIDTLLNSRGPRSDVPQHSTWRVPVVSQYRQTPASHVSSRRYTPLTFESRCPSTDKRGILSLRYITVHLQLFSGPPTVNFLQFKTLISTRAADSRECAKAITVFLSICPSCLPH